MNRLLHLLSPFLCYDGVMDGSNRSGPFGSPSDDQIDRPGQRCPADPADLVGVAAHPSMAAPTRAGNGV